MDILTTDMDIGAKRRGKPSLWLLLMGILRLTPGMDTMVDTMDILTTPMDITIMARDLLKLKQSLKLRLKLNHTMDIMVDMDAHTLVDITMERDLLKLSQKLIPRLIPGMATMVDTMDTPMVITGAESK